MAKSDTCIENSMGIYGATIVADTSATTGPFIAIEFVTAGAFSALSLNGSTGTFTGVTFPAGFRLLGRIASFTLSSGTVVAYKGQVA